MTYRQDAESCTCIIYRKDRAHPTEVTEFMSECKRGTQPWQSHPRRMLRHKAPIQRARLAFGFGGIYDQDRSEEHTSELQSLMRISYAVFRLKKKIKQNYTQYIKF